MFVPLCKQCGNQIVSTSLFGGIIYPRSCEKCPKTHLPCTAFEGISGLTSVVTTVTLRPFFT